MATADVFVVQVPEFRVWNVIAPAAMASVVNRGTSQCRGDAFIASDTAFQGARVICRGPRIGLDGFHRIFEGAPVTFRTSGDPPFFETTERVRSFFITDLPGDQVEVALLIA